jgi:GDP-mannose pyrophosphatase NudK
MNNKYNILEKKILSDNWYTLYKYTYETVDKKGKKKEEQREAYDRGNGAVILLYNSETRTVILTRGSSGFQHSLMAMPME